MDITLSPEHEKFVREKIETGEYQTPSEVVNDAMDALKESPRWTLERLRKEIAIGIDQLDRGEGKPWDVEEIKAEGRRLFAEKRKGS